MAQSARDDTTGVRRNVTQALAEVSRGAPEAQTRLFDLVYGELRRLAAKKMGAPRDPLLQPTVLVHEAYLRLLGGDASHEWHDRAHFFSSAAVAMRSILVDHARRRGAQKRGGEWVRITLSAELAGANELSERILQVNEALESFARRYRRQAKVVELLFFGGLSVEETATLVEASTATVKRDWRFSRAWLMKAIQDE